MNAAAVVVLLLLSNGCDARRASRSSSSRRSPSPTPAYPVQCTCTLNATKPPSGAARFCTNTDADGASRPPSDAGGCCAWSFAGDKLPPWHKVYCAAPGKIYDKACPLEGLASGNNERTGRCPTEGEHSAEMDVVLMIVALALGAPICVAVCCFLHTRMAGRNASAMATNDERMAARDDAVRGDAIQLEEQASLTAPKPPELADSPQQGVPLAL